MIEAVLKYGAKTFNDAGIRAIGYPGMFSHTRQEVAAICEFLNQEQISQG